MEIFTFASTYVESPITGVKVPVFDKRVILTVSKEEAAIHSWVLNRPAVLICELNDEQKGFWLQKLMRAINANQN